MSAAGDDPEVVVRQPHHRQVGAEAAPAVEDRGVDDAADLDVGLADDDRLDRLERSRSENVKDREGGEVDQGRRLAHLQVLSVDDG